MTGTALLAIAAAMTVGSLANGRNPAMIDAGEHAAALVAATIPTVSGEQLFQSHCAMCHAEGNLHPGTVKLRINGQSQPTLASRTDLDADYVGQVARQGLSAMPPFTPTQLPDADLDRIAQWLAAHK